MTWNIVQSGNGVTRISIEHDLNSKWEFKILLSSDRHIDNKHSDLRLQRKHLNEALKNNWPIIDIGDAFDAMQGRKDPRLCRTELVGYLHDKEEYFDAVVDYTYDFLQPYQKQFAMIGLGNHETSVLRHNETNLTKRLVKRLKEGGSKVAMGGYAGWIKLSFTGSSEQRSLNIRYTHGGGGNSPVTKGVIKTNRRAVVFPDANIIISGHTHEAFCLPLARERLSMAGKIYSDNQLHVQIPSYKDSTTGIGSGWEIEKEFPTKPVGAYWLRFFYDRSTRKIKYDATLAA